MRLYYSDKPHRKQSIVPFPGAGIDNKALNDRRTITALAERTMRKANYNVHYKRIAGSLQKLKDIKQPNLVIEKADKYALNSNLELVLIA